MLLSDIEEKMRLVSPNHAVENLCQTLARTSIAVASSIVCDYMNIIVFNENESIVTNPVSCSIFCVMFSWVKYLFFS